VQPVRVNYSEAKAVLIECLKEALAKAEGDMTLDKWEQVAVRMTNSLSTRGYHLCIEEADYEG